MDSTNPLNPKFQHGNREGINRVPALKEGLHQGVVVGSAYPNQTCTVRLKGMNYQIECKWAAGILSGLLGFKTSYLPPIKTEVLVYYTGKHLSIIVASFPTVLIDPGNQNREITDPDVANYQESEVFQSRTSEVGKMAASNKPPVDLMEGEILIDNQMGVAIELLRNFCAMAAGDLARVECHVLDDMVRIISDTFKHFTAFGDYQIYNDGGKLNVVWNGAAYDYEALGIVRPQDPKATLKDADNIDMTASLNGFTDDGRWRFTQYLGWLGNFVNIFVTDPVATLGKMAAGQIRSGKSRFHCNTDGSVLVQSVADIVLEKVVRIVVPVPIKRPEDPTGNRSDTPPAPNPFLAAWNPSNEGNLFEMVYQLREYARWLNNSYSLSRFLGQTLDYQVPTEAQTPVPLLNSGEVDKTTVNAGINNWRIVYSTIRIFRDGSQMHMDAYGNSWVSTPNGIQISSTQDILIQAAGSVNIVGGRDVNILAQNNVGLTAVLQAVRIKSQTALQMLSVAGNMIFEVLGDFVAYFNSIVNINSTIELNSAGTINALNTITGLTVSALTNGGRDLDSGSPVVPSIDGAFMFQSSYGGPSLYETMSQQAFRIGDQTGTGNTWTFSTNGVSGKGSPWPGLNIQQKFAPGGNTLQQPVNGQPVGGTPQAMQSTGVSLKTQA